MKINLHRIGTEDVYVSVNASCAQFEQLKALTESGEAVFRRPLRGTLRVSMVRDVILVTGLLATMVALSCSRCLKRYEHPLECRLALTFVPQPSEEAVDGLPDDYQLDAYQADLNYFSGDEIDLRDSLSEQVMMALPYKPLCHPACKGLCSRCGADLNEETCRCNTASPDGPFAVLQQLKGRGKNQ